MVTHASSASLPISADARSRISCAALLVNVSASIFHGFTPCSTKFAMRYVKTLVLPDPAPASTSSGPSRHSTASCCLSLRTDRSIILPLPYDRNYYTIFLQHFESTARTKIGSPMLFRLPITVLSILSASQLRSSAFSLVSMARIMLPTAACISSSTRVWSSLLSVKE